MIYLVDTLHCFLQTGYVKDITLELVKPAGMKIRKMGLIINGPYLASL
jgi:hypothetical protein